MKRLAGLVLLVGLGGLLGRNHAPAGELRVMSGSLTRGELALLQKSGASLRLDPCGFYLKRDAAGATGLFWLRQHYQLCQEICVENIANVHTYLAADGHPYRRKTVLLDDGGTDHVTTDGSDYRFVYDPTNPNAEKMGPHSGYIEVPNINLLSELKNQTRAKRAADFYDRVLGKFEDADPLLVSAGAPAPVTRAEEVAPDPDDQSAPSFDSIVKTLSR